MTTIDKTEIALTIRNKIHELVMALNNAEKAGLTVEIEHMCHSTIDGQKHHMFSTKIYEEIK